MGNRGVSILPAGALSKRELKPGDRVRVKRTGACGQVYSKGIARDAHVTVAWDNGHKGSICVALLERA